MPLDEEKNKILMFQQKNIATNIYQSINHCVLCLFCSNQNSKSHLIRSIHIYVYFTSMHCAYQIMTNIRLIDKQLYNFP